MKKTLSIVSCFDLADMEKELAEVIYGGSIDYIFCEALGGTGRTRCSIRVKAGDSLPIDTIADCLTLWIKQRYERIIMRNILYANTFGLTKEELLTVLKSAEQKISFTDKILFFSIIKNNVLDYLEESDTFFIEGFVRFRLKEYFDYMETIVNAAIEDFCTEKEYEDFIGLVKEYIEMQRPVIGLLHIKENANGEFSLYDLRKTEIAVTYDEEADKLFYGGDMTNADRLISIVLFLAPKQIIWHGKETLIYQTLKQIFEDNITVCRGCELCEQDNKD